MTTSLAPHPLLIPPSLAKEIGLHEAVILQQIHYWLEKSNHLINGCRWIYNTYQAWQQQFPFLSLGAIRRAIARLEGMNLLKTERFEQRRWNQTKWYSINYQRLEVLISSIGSNRVVRSAQIEQLNVSNLSSSSTKTKTITTSKTTSPSTQSAEVEREKEKLLDKTVVVRSCTSPVAENELANNEQTNLDKDLSSVVGDCTEKKFDGSSCKESPAIKPELSAPIQSTPVNNCASHEHDSNGGDRLAASSNPPVFDADTPRTQLLTRLSVLTTESLDSLHLNTALASALDRYPDRVPDALEYFQQALATWKNRPGISLFIHAVKSGQKPSLTKPGCGWKEWADEAVKRRLMQYSQSHNGDIMVHFALGGQGLWSQLRGLSWSEVELIAKGEGL